MKQSLYRASFKALTAVAALTLVSSTTVLAQRPPKAQQAPPTRLQHGVPAVLPIQKTLAIVMLPDHTPHILTDEQAKTMEGMNPGQLANFIQQLADTNTQKIVRGQLQNSSIGNNEVQDAVWNFIQVEERKFRKLYDLKAQIIDFLQNPKNQGDKTALSTLLAAVEEETDVMQEQYAVDLAELDKKIHYSANARLQAALDTLGLLKEGPFFSLGLSYAEMSSTKLLSVLKPRHEGIMATFVAFEAEADKKVSPADRLQAIGMKAPELRDAVLSFIDAQDKNHQKLRDLKTHLIGLLKNTTTAADDATTLKAAFDAVVEETEATQKQYALDLAELDKKVHYSQNTPLKASLDALGLLQKDSTFAFGLSGAEMLNLKIKIALVGELGNAVMAESTEPIMGQPAGAAMR